MNVYINKTFTIRIKFLFYCINNFDKMFEKYKFAEYDCSNA